MHTRDGVKKALSGDHDLSKARIGLYSSEINCFLVETEIAGFKQRIAELEVAASSSLACCI